MPPKRKRTKYTDEALISAIAEIKNGASYRQTSSKYGVPVMTLSDKIKEKTPLGRGRPGPTTILSADQ
jgi:transposase-like protein